MGSATEPCNVHEIPPTIWVDQGLRLPWRVEAVSMEGKLLPEQNLCLHIRLVASTTSDQIVQAYMN